MGGCIPFDCLISPKIFCFNALKIKLSFVKKKTKNTLKNSFCLEILKHEARRNQNILDILFVLYCPNFLFKGVFFVFVFFFLNFFDFLLEKFTDLCPKTLNLFFFVKNMRKMALFKDVEKPYTF